MKRSDKKKDASLEVNERGREFFNIKRKRKNTLSGKKRSYNSDSNETVNKRRSISSGSEIHLVNILKKQENKNSTMIKITNNCDNFLQAYNSGNSGDSSGESKNKEIMSTEKRNMESSIYGNHHRGSHVRFNSLADISNKYNTQNNLKFKNGRIAPKELRTPLGRIDTNIPEIKSHSFYHKLSDESKRSSEEFNIMNLLESHNTIEDKLPEPISSMTNMMYNNHILVGIDKPKEPENSNEAEKSRCNCKKSR